MQYMIFVPTNRLDEYDPKKHSSVSPKHGPAPHVTL